MARMAGKMLSAWRRILAMGPKIRPKTTLIRTYAHRVKTSCSTLVKGRANLAAAFPSRLFGPNTNVFFSTLFSLALFASAVRLLNQDPPKYIADDGSLLDSSPLKRRDELPRELELPTTPVAFETFITMIKEKQARETAA